MVLPYEMHYNPYVILVYPICKVAREVVGGPRGPIVLPPLETLLERNKTD
jgi:hypothetical protein